MIIINPSSGNALKIFQPFFPLVMPNLGIGFLASALQKESIDFRLLDQQLADNPLEIIENYIKNGEITKPYVFAFSILTASYDSALKLAGQLKEKYSDSVIIFGGIHPTAMPEESLNHNFVDYVIVGESERTLPEFYRRIKNGKDCSDIDNVYYKDNCSIKHSGRVYYKDDLDEYPFPYHLFTDPRYDLNFMMTSRGCPYNCIFCSNRVTTGKAYRFKSSDSIIEELDMLNKKYNKTNIGFFDDNFLVNKNRVYELTEKIKSRGLDKKMTFGCQCRGDNVDKQILIDLYNAGFKSIFFGVESACNRLLEIIKKGETIEQLTQAIRYAQEAKMTVSATFIYALPTEKRKDRMASMDFSRNMNLDIVRFNNATPYPGTELYDIAKKQNRLFIQGNYENFNSVSAFIENPFKPIPFSYVPPGNSEGEIRDDILWSYLKFYFRFSKIKGIFTKAEKSTGWFSPGKTIMGFFKKIPALIILGTILSAKFSMMLFRRLFRFNIAN